VQDFRPVHCGDEVSDDAVRRIYRGLLEKDLPKVEWTHGAHLCAGTMMVRTLGLQGAEATMPGAIRAYNEAVGGVNSDSEGYHHTITLFYLRVLNKFLEGRLASPVGALASAVLQAPIAARDYPLSFYTRDRLFSVEARKAWAPPDLQEI